MTHLEEIKEYFKDELESFGPTDRQEIEDMRWLIARVEKLEKALEFYAQKPEPDITSEFAKSAEEWGECCATWEPLVDLGQKAREALATEGLEQGDSEEDG